MTNFVTAKTVKTVNKVIDGTGPDASRISVNPFTPSGSNVVVSIQLVIGAEWDHRFCSNISKKGLKELIEILQDIHDAMEDY